MAAAQIRLLVVEDHPAMAETVEQLLSDQGLEFRITSSDEAIRVAIKFRPNFVVCDFDLNTTTHCERLVRELRESSEGAQLHAVAYTVDPSTAKAAEARSLGFDELWEKSALGNRIGALPSSDITSSTE